MGKPAEKTPIILDFCKGGILTIIIRGAFMPVTTKVTDIFSFDPKELFLVMVPQDLKIILGVPLGKKAEKQYV